MIQSSNGFDFKISRLKAETRHYFFAFSILLLILLIVYGNSFHNSWHYDDYINIVDNESIHINRLSWESVKRVAFDTHSDSGKIKRPLSYLTLGLNHYFGKDNVFGYHVVNYVIHYLTGIILFAVIYNTLKLPVLRERYERTAYAVALMSAFLWATHPIHVSAVTYIVQRMAALAAMFYILTFYFYIKARTTLHTPKRVLFISFAFFSAICAFSSKENTFILPAALYLFEFFLIHGEGRQRIRKNLVFAVIPLLCIMIAAVYFIDFTTITQSYENRPFTLYERLLTEPRVIIHYLYLLAYPITSNLTLLHDIAISRSLWMPWTTVPAIVIVLSLTVLALKYAQNFPLAAFCLLFFFLNHLTEGSVIPLELIYEHRNYLPSMFLFILPVIWWLKAFDYFSNNRLLRSLLGILFVLLLAAQSHTTRIYNGLYKNELILWGDAKSKSPGLSIVHNNYGSALWESGQYEAAYEAFKKAYDIDYYINVGQKGIVLYNLGYYHLMIRHDGPKAIEYFKAAQSSAQGWRQLWTNLSRAYLMINDPDRAGKIITDALNYWPKDENLRHLQGILKFKENDFASAYRIAKGVHYKTPQIIAPLIVMGESCRRMGMMNKASNYYENVIERQPDNLRGLMALIEIYSQKGETHLRNQKVVDLLSLKKERTWAALFQNMAAKSPITVYSPEPKILLPIIEASLRDLGKEASLSIDNR